jgi:hypothetical protein
MAISKLLKNSNFFKSQNQRSVALQVTQEFVIDENLELLSAEQCLNGHESVKLVKMTVWIVTNSPLNNYTLEKNENASRSKAKKRKIQTLEK